MFRVLAILWMVSSLFAAVSPGQALAQALSEPEKNFEHLWKTYDRNYALFGAKHLDWDALYKVYRPRVTSSTAEDELFQVMPTCSET